jgi:biopolymer transport protein ExbB
MNAVQELIDRGGPAVMAIMVLSVVLYSQCFTVLFGLRRSRILPRVVAAPAAERPTVALHRQDELRDRFRQDRVTLGALIAAAPLLGLLGTVSGMVTTFESLSRGQDQTSMEGLAAGISEVLLTTESGLAVAIPAMVLVYAAHRLLSRRLDELGDLAVAETGGRVP